MLRRRRGLSFDAIEELNSTQSSINQSTVVLLCFVFCEEEGSSKQAVSVEEEANRILLQQVVLPGQPNVPDHSPVIQINRKKDFLIF